MDTFIALLRGINVTGKNKVPMAELRSLCTDLGWQDVQSYIQSGNLVFKAAATVHELEAQLEQAMESHFGLSISVIVRDGAGWPAYVQANPFPDASQREPNRVMLALSKAAPKGDAAEGLQARASANERIAQVGDALWIHYGDGAGRSKLTPALLNRLVGSPVTARNWRTVLKLDELAQAAFSE